MRVYVRRRGRMTAAQARAINAFLPKYLLAPPAGVVRPDFWHHAFDRPAPLAVEIGFGNGAALASLAQANPDWNCVGVDVYRPGFGALITACEREGIGNVRIVETEARSLLSRLSPASVHAIYVFFPDPWPKARHHKRRLVNADFATAAVRCLEPAGTLRLATDSMPYAEHMACVLGAQRALEGGTTERPAARPVTAFEAKGVAGGRSVTDLLYRRAGG